LELHDINVILLYFRFYQILLTKYFFKLRIHYFVFA